MTFPSVPESGARSVVPEAAVAGGEGREKRSQGGNTAVMQHLVTVSPA